MRIDWQAMQVELAGEVVMREGLIELFACSRGTREHESIVRIDARPLHVYEALGLIGLEPGRPGYFDDAAQKWIVPTGDHLHASIRIDPEPSAGAGESPQSPGKPVSVWQWMRETKSKQTPQPRDWVFCGSRRAEDGRFLADAEGTVLCVVDFTDALIALAEAHTADNAEIWLEADPRRVPPKGTRCTIILRPASDGDKTRKDVPANQPTDRTPSDNPTGSNDPPSPDTGGG